MLAQCPPLAHLDLIRNYHFGSAGAERVPGVLGQCRELVQLNLAGNDIFFGPGSTERLVEVLGHNPVLALVDLSNNGIVEAGADVLVGVLGQCSALAHLNFYRNCRQCWSRDACWLTSISAKIRLDQPGQRVLREC